MKIKTLLLGLAVACPSIMAAPVVYDGVSVNSTSSMSNSSQATLDQKIQIIQQSLDNIKAIDFPNKIQQLQRQIQLQQGTIEVLQHKVDALQKQQSLQYQDLVKQIEQSKGGAAPVSVESPVQPVTAEANVVPENTNISPSEQDRRTYQSAYGLVTSHQYSEAIDAFQAYLEIYHEDGLFSANANYWLGELYAQQKQYDKAKDALNTVISDFPKSNKTPDATLKLGVIAVAEGNVETAQTYFDQVIEGYPNSGSARLAKQKMQEISAH